MLKEVMSVKKGQRFEALMANGNHYLQVPGPFPLDTFSTIGARSRVECQQPPLREAGAIYHHAQALLWVEPCPPKEGILNS